MGDKEKIWGKTQPSCPTSPLSPPPCPREASCPPLSQGGVLPTEGTITTSPFRCKVRAAASVKGETCSRKPAWKSLQKRGCLRGASGSQDAWESCPRLQPAVSEEDSPSLDSGFPGLLGDAQYMRRCKSGQSEDFIYII